MAVAIGYIYHHNDQASVAFGANVLKYMRETGHTNAVLIDPYGALIDYVGGGQSGDAAQKSLGAPFWDSLGDSSTVWTRDERKKVDTGTQLLRIATDGGSSTEERTVAYKQAMRTLEGIVALPEKGQRKLIAAIGLIER